MGRGAARRLTTNYLTIGLVAAFFMGTFMWTGRAEAFWSWDSLSQCRAELDTCEADLVQCEAGSGTDPGCTEGVRFINKGLTVYDCQENLEWEKKTEGNVGVTSTWSVGDPWNFDGTAAAYINALNAVGFAGHKDWRLPMVAQDGGTAELETIVDCSGGSPCIDPIFGPTVAGFYWSSVTVATTPPGAWGVNFLNGDVFDLAKPELGSVRAVRTGP